MMTFTKASTLTVGFVAAFGLGVWIGPHVTHRGAEMRGQVATTSPAGTATGAHGATPAGRAAPGPTAAAPASKVRIERVALTSPRLREREKPLLDHADMTKAVSGFHSALQFATVAHAAHDTGIPFILLKHRVVVEHKALPAAITESRPALNGPVVANLARAEAMSDLAALAS